MNVHGQAPDRAPQNDVRLGILRRAVDEALRPLLTLDEVSVGEIVPRPRGTLSIPAGGSTVHLSRPSPFDDVESRVAEEVVRQLGAAVIAWSDMADRSAAYVEDVLSELDLMVDAGVEERLARVASRASRDLGAAGWSVGFLDRGRLITMTAQWPAGAAGAAAPDFALHRARLTSEPLLRAFEGGSFVATAEGDDVTSELLRDLGMGTVVGAGGYDADALQWLVMVFSEGPGQDLCVARGALVAATQAALGFPRAPLLRP